MGLGIEVGEYLAARLQGYPAELMPYCHAEVFAGQADDRVPHGYTYSAYPNNGSGGVTGRRPLPCPPQQLPGAIWSSGLYELTDAQRAGIIAWCEAHPCVKYSFLDYGAIALRALRLPVPGLQKFISSTSRMMCSYYSDAAWNRGGGVHLFDDQRWEGYVTPWDLAALLLARVQHPAATSPGT
jgi:hypothetical protein